MELYLVRHAQDRASVERRYEDWGLTQTGLGQASDLAQRLRPVAFDRCLCSPLRRAVETARVLVEGREIAVEQVDELAEGLPGALSGLAHAEAIKRFPEDFRLGRTVGARLAATGRTAPQGESLEQFRARAGRALARIERERPRCARLLVVSHGGLLNYLLQTLLGIDAWDRVPFGFEHCGVLRLLDYQEEPGFGPFPMLRFGPQP